MFSLTFVLALAQYAAPGGGWYESIWDKPTDVYFFSEVQPTADLSGDGIPEIILLGSRDSNSVRVIDGATGERWFKLDPSPLDRFELTWQTADLDGDGLPELILGNPVPAAGEGQIVVVHGGDGQIMWQAWGRDPGDLLGQRILLADFDGDGLADLFTGSKSNGKAVALSGLTGDRLWMQYGLEQKFTALAPDLDGDRLADLLVGGNSRLTAISGGSGALIWSVPTQQLTHAGGWKSYYSDLNQDGVSDVLVARSKQKVNLYYRAGLIEAYDGATGHFLWSKDGGADLVYLGQNAQFMDFTGDGVADFLSLFPYHPMLLDGSTGEVVWERSLNTNYHPDDELILQDFSGDDIPDILAYHYGDRFLQLEVINSANGRTVWARDAIFPSEEFTQLTLADFDSDDIMDILAISPEADVNDWRDGLARAFSGATGAELWHVAGATRDSDLGRFSVITEADARPGQDVILSEVGGKNRPRRVAINGMDGSEIWSVTYDTFEGRLKTWAPVDLNGNGKFDVVETRWGYPENWVTFIGFDGREGHQIWSNRYESERLLWGEMIGPWPDLSGDGVDEVMVNILSEYPEGLVKVISGADGGVRNGVELSVDRISVSGGGAIQAQVHFPPNQAGWNYQLLLSETGKQSTDLNGLEVPLSPGYWLSSTYIGFYPSGLFNGPMGSLDNESNALITLNALPNQIAPAFIGTTMYLAVISAEPGSPWSFSSGASAVQILP
jgi:putative pyrroloquinoline-quinone binding quinoprotein/VCBS repeat protein